MGTFGGTALRTTVAAPQARVIAGTTAVAVILGLSRWGTNIGVSPLFITDVLIALTIVNSVVSNSLKGVRPITGWTARATPSALFIAFFVFVVFRFLFSLGNGPLIDWVRDAVPFLYGVMAFISARSIASSQARGREGTMRIFWWALSIHLIWTAVAFFSGSGGGLPVSVPFFTAPIFQIRPDIDSALIAVAVGMLLRNLLLARHRSWSLLGILVGSAVVLSLGTRAGLISLVAAMSVSFGLTYAMSGRQHPRRTVMVLLIPAIVLIAAVIIPTTTPGQRLLATFDPGQSFSAAQQNAQGTQRARELTWSMVMDWTNETPARQLVGSGFGNDILAESGTKAFLEGTTYENVRSPHNWFVGIYARMGLVGLVLALGVVVQTLLLIWRSRRRIGADPLLAVSALTIIAILPVASLGVVLEAPFGAVPFFWALGVIHALGSASTNDADSSRLSNRARLFR